MTPLQSPISASEQRYNEALQKTRFKVECAIGLWKSVFRCVHKSGGILLYTPAKVCKIVCSTLVLHNIRRKLRLPEDEEFIPEPDPETPVCEDNLADNALTVLGNQLRRNLIDNYF